MKFILYILISSTLSFAQAVSKSALAAKFSDYVKSDSVDGNYIKDYRDLVLVELTDQDSRLIENALLVLVKLDKVDPSRTSVQILSQAYDKNPKLFHRAFQEIQTPESKDVLEEIEDLMKSFYNGGNG